VFEVLSEGHFHGIRFTVPEIAEKAKVHQRAVGGAIYTLRRLGFRVNCKFREHIEGVVGEQVFEYWFPAEGEADENYRSKDGIPAEDIAEIKSVSLDVLSLELEDMERRLEEMSELASARLGLMDAAKAELAELKRAKVTELIGRLKDDVLVEMAAEIAPLLGVTMDRHFRERAYEGLKKLREKK
jgi:hypothetical protein